VRVVDKKLAFIFLFCSALSCASEKSLVSAFHKNIQALKENSYVLSVVCDEKSAFPIVDIGLKQVNGEQENHFFCAVRMIARFIKQIDNTSNGPSTIINNVMTQAEFPEIMKYAKKIDDVPPFLEIFRSTQKETPYLDRIIVYNSAATHSSSLSKNIKSNALQYETIDNITSSKEHTFVYDDFDVQALMQQIDALQKTKTIYSFSMIISQGENACGVAFFTKNRDSFIECIMIGANDTTKALIKQIVVSIQQKDMLKIFIARFVVAQYSQLVAKEKLIDLGLDVKHPLFLLCLKEGGNNEEDNKKLQKTVEELTKNKTTLESQLLELKGINSGLQKIEEQLLAEKTTITNLNNKIVELRAALAKNRWKYGCDLISNIFTAIFQHASVSAVFWLALTYSMFFR